jgi:hypothetical protein
MVARRNGRLLVNDPRLDAMIGGQIVGLARVFYVYKGAVEELDGELELRFPDRIARFRGGSDGEKLLIQDSPWVDPFVQPMSEVNTAYVESSGKWTRFEKTEDPPYSSFVGSRVIGVDPVLTIAGKLIGCLIRTSSGDINVLAEWDEIHVTLSVQDEK